MPSVTWQPDTPSLNSVEDTRGGSGPLTTNYTDGVDCRWRGQIQLGPLPTTIVLSGSDGTSPSVTNVKAGAFTEGIDAAEKLALIRGKRLAFIKLSNRTMVTDGSATAFAADATDIIYSKSSGGTEELSVALSGSNAYQVVTTAPDTGGYTFTANNETIINRFFGRPGSKNTVGQIVGLGVASSVENIVRQNILTGSTTMDASSWQTRATISSFPLTFTGFATSSGYWIIGTDAGPLFLNEEFQVFEPRIPELTRSTNNCTNMRENSFLGVVCPLERSTRIFQGLGGESVGPDQFKNNQSNIQGRLTAQCYSELWGYWAFYNSRLDTTYICAVRPRENGDAHSNRMSYYPLVTLTNLDCNMLEFAGTKGSQTNPTVYYGRDSDVAWFIEGRDNRFPDDTNCTYQSSGTWYGTQIRRHPGYSIVPRAFRLRTSGCTSSETVTFSVDYLDHTGTSTNTQIGGAITENGVHWLEVTKDRAIEAEFLAPKVALARGATTTNTPKVLGDIEMIYDLKPLKDRSGRTLADFKLEAQRA